MLTTHPDKCHPEFDIAKAREVFADLGLSERLEGEQITSPFDVYSIETLRDLHNLRFGDAIPTDMFVIGKGEAPRRDLTKIGGKPYWPKTRPWPARENGLPWLFLAQINFADSRDIVTDLPGEVLVMLVEDAEEYIHKDDNVRFEWFPLGLEPVEDWDATRSAIQAGPFFGAIHRTFDYPETRDRTFELEISQCWNISECSATKIGGIPNMIQSEPDYIKGEYICQLSSIQAAPNVPYPWVNEKEPLALRSFKTGIYAHENNFMIGDMGTIYISRTQNGVFRSQWECY